MKGTSPLGLTCVAVGLAAAFMVLHLCGLRDYTVVFAGASPGGGPATLLEVAGGVGYVVLFLSMVTVTPILLLASGFFVGLQALFPVKGADDDQAG